MDIEKIAEQFQAVPDGPLRHQLVDFAINSGPFITTQRLQAALGIEATGKLDPETLSALSEADNKMVNNRLLEERVKLLCRLCVKNPSQLKFLGEWVNRAFEFLV